MYGVNGALSTPPPITRTPHSIHTNKSNGSNITFSGRNGNQRKETINTNTYEAKDKWRRLEVAPEAMDCLQLVKEGTYGRVYSGTLLVKGCNNNSTGERQHKINNNEYDNDNEDATETRKVLIKTVLGEWRNGLVNCSRLLLNYLIISRLI